jgi:triosephosphate isomerase
MHQTPDETVRFVRGILDGLAGEPSAACLFVCPPYTSLTMAAAAARGTVLWIGAQNMHWAPSGAYTGEISPVMLKAIGVDLVLLGHAERRRQFSESNRQIRMKVRAAAEHGLRILLCVGETIEERDNDVGPETISRQLKVGLRDLPPAWLSHLLVAYEPVWSIGDGGIPAPPQDVLAMVRHARGVLEHMFGPPARSVPILYGGSVDQHNCGEFASLPEIDGLFVGRAAWTVEGFLAVLRAAEHARPRAPSQPTCHGTAPSALNGE